MTARVVESESVESHVFSWSRSRESESFFLNCWSRSRVFKNAGVGVGSRFFKTAGVGVGSRFFNTAGVGVGILKNLPTPQPCV